MQDLIDALQLLSGRVSQHKSDWVEFESRGSKI